MEKPGSVTPIVKVSPHYSSRNQDKRFSQVKGGTDTHIVITKCLTIPCPRKYTDSIAETIEIICRSPDHARENGDNRNG
jgi:hypothetical protein